MVALSGGFFFGCAERKPQVLLGGNQEIVGMYADFLFKKLPRLELFRVGGSGSLKCFFGGQVWIIGHKVEEQ